MNHQWREEPGLFESCAKAVELMILIAVGVGLGLYWCGIPQSLKKLEPPPVTAAEEPSH